MKFRHLRSEWRALFTNKKILIPVLAVLFIPVLYSGMFLWAFWDPYENLDQIPVAVVNEDNGADFEGEHIDIGNELVDKLKDDPKFKWDFVNEEEANKGLEDQTYYMKIQIPEDFSKRSTTVLNEQPEKLNLKYVPNESFNFLAGQIGGTAVSEIKSQIANNITENYSELVFDKFSEIADGLSDASDGALDLADGSSDLKVGTEQLKENVAKLNNGSIELTNGVSELQNGSVKLSNGLEEASQGSTTLLTTLEDKQSKINELDAGAGQVSQGVNQFSDGLSEFKSGQESLLAGVEQSKGGIHQIITKLEDKSRDVTSLGATAGSVKEPIVNGGQGAAQVSKELQGVIQSIQSNGSYSEEEKQALISQLKPIAEKSAGAAQSIKEGGAKLESVTKSISSNVEGMKTSQNELITALQSLYDGQVKIEKGLLRFGNELDTAREDVSQLQAGADKVAEGTANVSSGWQEMITNVSKLNSGVVELENGSQVLVTGLTDLEGGSSELSSGAGQLLEGSKKLDNGAEKVTDGSNELHSKLDEAAKETVQTNADEDTYNMFADPVDVESDATDSVPNYGTGFAPYFLSLGLFVGALLMSIVFPLREPAGDPKSALEWFVSKYGILLTVGVIQALVADAVLLYGLDIEVQSVAYFILFSVISSLTYMTMIQFFVTTMGDPGRFVAIIILILQLTTSAGTFPLELIPEGLQIFNTWLPMTYTVSGLKAVISSGDFAFMWNNVLILLGFTLIFAVGTIVFFFMEMKKRRNKGFDEPVITE
ncbi:YhgE/Pip domain-containing protein [Guptibacillus algicola]|uniref:YhgE/Pip domain-containing protein n=1 Tax=Guptibacillus algicola TaxID=225844 RepID=UPI001CD77EF8|nr:YhgE/Pip domain-containing protein [Alkalihalobacillus algicola]MCA0989163.1 YhgE/Pip domain-containing protein [Alkalihalobacillus algicola]